jgi:hypothetical protein
MAIRVKRFPAFDLNLYVVGGPHTGRDAIRFYEGMGAPDAARWLTYFDPTVDVSEIGISSLPKLRRAIAAKQKELFGETPPPRIIVCSSAAQKEFFLRFWTGYLVKGDVRPPKATIVSSLEAAYDWLGLPASARATVERAIQDDDLEEIDPVTGRTAPEPAPARPR